MVLRQALGAIDMLSAICCALIPLGYPIPHVQAVAALALIAKGAFFIDDIVSWLDIVCGVAMFILLWAGIPMLALALAIYLGFKAALSFAPV
ncbi:TPA: hypothetical protein HA251_02105 [Candidatus Woesearchaeota archaeon]|nr:hypothetical protein [Candidatus Woesearchaeota archaeon]